MTHEFEDDGMRHAGLVPTWQERKAELSGSLKRTEVDSMNRLRVEALRERDVALEQCAALKAENDKLTVMLNARIQEINNLNETIFTLRAAVDHEEWSHFCDAIPHNITLWVDRCPHCGMPRGHE